MSVIVNQAKLSQIKKDACKNEAKQRIAKYDWIADADTTPVLLNKSDFVLYRSALRELILNPVENPVFPIEPDPIWSN